MSTNFIIYLLSKYIGLLNFVHSNIIIVGHLTVGLVYVHSPGLSKVSIKRLWYYVERNECMPK